MKYIKELNIDFNNWNDIEKEPYKNLLDKIQKMNDINCNIYILIDKKDFNEFCNFVIDNNIYNNPYVFKNFSNEIIIEIYKKYKEDGFSLSSTLDISKYKKYYNYYNFDKQKWIINNDERSIYYFL